MMLLSEHSGVSSWADRVQAEYEEMPGLSLTKKQMERLWGFDPVTCDALIDVLVHARVLRRTRDGNYVAFDSAE
jgi:hypothetical protein